MFPNTRQYTHYSAPHSVHTRIVHLITFCIDRLRTRSNHASIYITFDLENSYRNTTLGFIHMDQTQDNMKFTLHILDQIQRLEEKTIILTLDKEKAFDSVSWQYLYRVLNTFG